MKNGKSWMIVFLVSVFYCVALGGSFNQGTKIVGVDMEPGTYRAPGAKSGCYWARLKGFSGSLDDTIANNIESGPAVVTIKLTDKGFESQRCGDWTSDLLPITKDRTSNFQDGTYVVGIDIAPGIWRTQGSQGCYWERLGGFSGELEDVITNNIASGSAVIEIQSTDKGFRASRCGTWQKVQ